MRTLADYGWATFKVWPWKDEWLVHDDVLRTAFSSEGLAEFDQGRWHLEPAADGEVQRDIDDRGPGPTFEIATLTGNMQGSSWQIIDSGILDVLRERRIAYWLIGDAAWDWDGDETFWHPGMRSPFFGAYNESGRVLDQSGFRTLLEKCLPVEQRIALVDDLRAHAASELGKARANGNEHLEKIWQKAIGRHNRRRAWLFTKLPAPLVFAAVVQEYFDADPLAWRPSARWKPRLDIDEGEEA